MKHKKNGSQRRELMKQTKDEVDLARFLRCFSILEGKVVDAYWNLACRVENPTVKTLLQYIMIDTSKHAEVLRDISIVTPKLEIKAEDCEKMCGEAWKTLMVDSLQELAENDRITDTELASQIDAMKNLESYLAEEYLAILNAETTSFLAKQNHVNLSNYSSILQWIVEDERRHEQVLNIIKNLATGESRIEHVGVTA
jgi:rubrerythrin